MTAWDRWNLSKMASWAKQGWFYLDIGNGMSILVHADKECTRTDCPQYGTTHRHLPTLEQRKQMYDCVTDWLRAEFDAEEESQFEQESTAELERLFRLPDPRPVPHESDADIRSIDECHRIAGTITYTEWVTAITAKSRQPHSTVEEVVLAVEDDRWATWTVALGKDGVENLIQTLKKLP